MHASEVGVLVARIVDTLVSEPTRLDWRRFDLETYWSASRVRLDRWSRGLEEAAEWHGSSEPRSSGPLEASADGSQDQRWFRVAEEILLGDLACRVWTAVLQQVHADGITQAARAVVRSIWTGQQTTRAVVLARLGESLEQDRPVAWRLNRLRRRAERWSDVLLARLPGRPADEFAIQPARVRDFRRGRAAEPAPVAPTWPSLHAALVVRDAGEDGHRANPLLNAQVYDSICGVVGESATVPVEGWWHRLKETTDRMDGWIAGAME